MKGLRRNRGYAVVRCNSTSGVWVAERTSKEELIQSKAFIDSVWTTRREAQRRASLLNKEEKKGVFRVEDPDDGYYPG